MNDIDKILLTSFLTIFTSVIILVFGQVVIRFIIDPVHDLKKTLGEIDFALAFHAPAIHTPFGKEEPENEAQKALMKLSCDLRAKTGGIPLYRFWSVQFCCSLPSKKNCLAAATHLRGLSNSVHDKDRSKKNSGIVSNIRLLLSLAPDE